MNPTPAGALARALPLAWPLPARPPTTWSPNPTCVSCMRTRASLHGARFQAPPPADCSPCTSPRSPSIPFHQFHAGRSRFKSGTRSSAQNTLRSHTSTPSQISIKWSDRSASCQSTKAIPCCQFCRFFFPGTCPSILHRHPGEKADTDLCPCLEYTIFDASSRRCA